MQIGLRDQTICLNDKVDTIFPDLASFCYIVFSDCVGYVVAVSPSRRSLSSQNEYFDIKVQNSPTDRQEIRVMVAKGYRTTNRNYYVDKKETQMPIRIKNISKSQQGTKFFNTSSAVECAQPHECPFTPTPVEEKFLSISEVLQYQSGTFNVKGNLLWQNSIRSPESCSQTVRDGLLLDDTASIKISIWEEHFTKVEDNQFYKFTGLNYASMVDYIYQHSAFLK